MELILGYRHFSTGDFIFQMWFIFYYKGFVSTETEICKLFGSDRVRSSRRRERIQARTANHVHPHVKLDSPETGGDNSQEGFL